MKKKMIPVRDFDLPRFIETFVTFWQGQVPSMSAQDVAFPIVQNGFADFGTDCLEDDADAVGDMPFEWLKNGLTLFAQFTRRFDGTYEVADGTVWVEPEDYEDDDVFLDEHSTYGFLIAMKGETLSIRTAVLSDVTGECVVRTVITTGPFEVPMVKFIRSMKR
jgi:hypothetical protein